MKVIKIYDIFRNDCTMDCQCEFCGHIDIDKSAYNDDYFRNTVVPKRSCSACGKSTISEINAGDTVQTKTDGTYAPLTFVVEEIKDFHGNRMASGSYGDINCDLLEKVKT